MVLKMQEADLKDGLDFTKWDFSFVGESVDDRGDCALKFAEENSGKKLTVLYDASEMELSVGKKSFIIDELEEQFKFLQDKKVLLEATTLNFAEILLLLKQMRGKCSEIGISYLEPKHYSKRRTDLIIHRREYELSGETLGYKPIPGFTGYSFHDVDKKAIFIAGYESERIDRGIEENSIPTNNCNLLFGVPAFQSGWEMNSFANNIRVIKEQSMGGEIFYASANNPGAIYDILNDFYKSLSGVDEFYIAPVGPKPAGIATAIFAVEKDDVGILYDHPIQKRTRSKEVQKWHLYNLNF